MTAGLKHDDEAGQFLPAPAQWIGPYRLIERLGEGGMGVVHLALDGSGRAVAVKVLREHIAHDADARSRLAREVQALARVQGTRVAAVLDADTEGPRPYIVTRYVPGPSLDKVVSDHGRLEGEALLRLGRGLSQALQEIHRAGVIHRDLKPGNVLLLDGDPVVIDFGIAHVADDIRLTMTGLVMGTPGYLSPEVVEGAAVTEATDWWGWAATLVFAASGSSPFGRGPMDVVLDRVRRGRADLSGVDPLLAPLLQAALSPRAAGRPHADEIVDALDRYAAGAPVTFPVAYPDLSSATPCQGVTATQSLDHGPVAGAERLWPAQPQPDNVQLDNVQPVVWQPAGGPEAAQALDGQADRDSAPGQPDPRIGRPARVGTLFALLAALVAVVSVRPTVGAGLVLALAWLARFADRSVTSLVLRRHRSGRRRRDVPVAVAASPWHLVIAAAASVIALVLPATVAVASTFSTALAVVAVSGGVPEPLRSIPLAAGGLVGLLMCWWGPGGVSLRRGSRSLIRGLTPGPATTGFVTGALLLVGAGLALYAMRQQGQPDLWPWTR